MSAHMERGRILLQQGRNELAKKELRLELNQNPNNAHAMGLLALCFTRDKQMDQAIQLIETAIGLDPNDTYLFYLQANIYLQANRPTDAETAANNGLLINPNIASFFQVKGNIALLQDDWESALANAEQGLELEPEDVDLINLRARALINLNRKQEAAATLDYALHHAPEDPLAHTNKGWVAIENDNYDEAVTHFREALRLSPTFRFAQTGLKEAIKGKNILYRQILKFFLWTSKMNDKARWQLVIGAYVIYLGFIKLAEAYPEVAPFLYPFIIFYVIWAFSSWISQPVSNAFLRLHPLGKLALTDDEKLASNIVGTFILIGLSCIISYYFLTDVLLVVIGGWFIIMLIPIGGLFGSEKGTKGRQYLTYYTLLLGLIGIGWIIRPEIDILLYAFAIGIFTYGLAANYLMMKAAKQY